MKGQRFHITSERSSFTLCVEGQTGGQVNTLLLSVHLNTFVSSWQ